MSTHIQFKSGDAPARFNDPFSPGRLRRGRGGGGKEGKRFLNEMTVNVLKVTCVHYWLSQSEESAAVLGGVHLCHGGACRSFLA